MDTLKYALSTISLVILALVLPGVSALSDRIPVIASAAVALFMLLILIVAIVFATCYAQSWIKTSMKRDGKVKMPRSYFEKKREAKRRLIAESVKSSRLTHETYVSQLPKPAPAPVPAPAPMANGVMPSPPPAVMDKETLVQGWNQNTRRIYEEKGYTMEMGDENEEEFFIETTITDNEVLDVGPYKNLESTSARPVDGNVYANPYIYTNNDRVTVTRSSDETGGVVSANNTGKLIPDGNGPDRMAVDINDKVIKL